MLDGNKGGNGGVPLDGELKEVDVVEIGDADGDKDLSASGGIGGAASEGDGFGRKRGEAERENEREMTSEIGDWCWRTATLQIADWRLAIGGIRGFV